MLCPNTHPVIIAHLPPPSKYRIFCIFPSKLSVESQLQCEQFGLCHHLFARRTSRKTGLAWLNSIGTVSPCESPWPLPVRQTNEVVTSGNGSDTLKRLLHTTQPLSLAFTSSALSQKVKHSSAISIVLARSVAIALVKRHFSRWLNSVWRKCHLTFPLRRDPHPPNPPAYITGVFSV